MHEAAIAILHLAPDKFWEFSSVLFEAQKDYFDVNVVNETRNTTYVRLARLAGEKVDGVSEEDVLKLLLVPDAPGKDGGLNVGNGVTYDVKFLVKVSCAC